MSGLAPIDRSAVGVDYAGDALARLSKINHELMNVFSDGGFAPIEPAVLQPASMLFDLYGEEIWERAYVLENGGSDADIGGDGWCLRPDFTAPVARAHLAQVGAGGAARYGYIGPVFRRPRAAADGPVQQLQAGVEIIGEDSPEAREAEVLDIARKAADWAGCGPLDMVVGDLAIAFALLEAAPAPEGWRRRLRRHFWRPQRFNALLRRFAGDDGGAPALAERMAFLKGVGDLDPEEAARAVAEMAALTETPQIGARSGAEVADRFLRQAADARAHPLPQEVVGLIENVLGVRGPAPSALETLRGLCKGFDVDLTAPLDRFERRLEAFERTGLRADDLRFDAAFGRELAYYDGFVFEIRTQDDQSASPLRLGGGGRYDRLFAALGADRPISGVGAALWPEAIAEASQAWARRDPIGPARGAAWPPKGDGRDTVAPPPPSSPVGLPADDAAAVVQGGDGDAV